MITVSALVLGDERPARRANSGARGAAAAGASWMVVTLLVLVQVR